jgi:hypothetical protein
MKFFILCLAAAMAYTAAAQELELNTKIRNEKRGEAAFTLKAGQRLFSFAPDDAGWYRVRKKAYVALQFALGDSLLANTTLRDKNDDEIGKTLQALKPVAIDTIKGFRKEDRLVVILEGFVYKTKWADNSIPEQEVSKLLQIRNRTEQAERFAALWEKYEAEERDFENFTAFVLRSPNASLLNETDFRLIVVFRDGYTPYSVITNKQNVNLPKVKDQWQEGDLAIKYLYKPSSTQKELMQTILFTYLAL